MAFSFLFKMLALCCTLIWFFSDRKENITNHKNLKTTKSKSRKQHKSDITSKILPLHR